MDDEDRKALIRRTWADLGQSDSLDVQMPGGINYQVRRAAHEKHTTIPRAWLDDMAQDDNAARKVRGALLTLVEPE